MWSSYKWCLNSKFLPYNLKVFKQEDKTAKRYEFYDRLERLNKGCFLESLALLNCQCPNVLSHFPFKLLEVKWAFMYAFLRGTLYSAFEGTDAALLYMTLTLYQHKMFVGTASEAEPVIVGPSIIQMSKRFKRS